MPEQVQPGLIVYSVVDQRLILATVLIVAGVITTQIADTPDPATMCQSDASEPQLQLQLWRLHHLAAV